MRLDFEVSVCDVDKPDATGTVRDISETGIGTNGIAVEVDEIKTLMVLGDVLDQVVPFACRARCRWTSSDESDGRIPCRLSNHTDLCAGSETVAPFSRVGHPLGRVPSVEAGNDPSHKRLFLSYMRCEVVSNTARDPAIRLRYRSLRRHTRGGGGGITHSAHLVSERPP